MKTVWLVLAAAMVATAMAAGPAADTTATAPSAASAPATSAPATPGPFESGDAPTADTPIDKLVLHRLQGLGIRPANVCSDAVFVRRAFMDVIGTLPTAQEAGEFLRSTEPLKRRALIDRLLARDEFADYWAMKWSDLLRVKAEFPINLWPSAAQAYYRWIRACVRDNKPYDRFARELLTASGSNFRSPPVNFYRAVQSRQPEAIAQAVALTFMGARAEKWPKERLAGMAAFFSNVGYKSTSEWKEEIIYFDFTKAASQPAATFPDGAAARVAENQDPREAFADWLIDAKNPWFARAIANRMWYWLLGRGIVQEPDDIRPDNPPANPELLAYLEREVVASHYDLKHVFRLILNSQTYQLSCIPTTTRPEAAANFASYPLRRLDAEVLIDALCQITGTSESYSSAIPEPFTYIPGGWRTVQLPDSSITSSFLEMFGRPARNTGLESERNNRPSAQQRLFLLNSGRIHDKFSKGAKIQALLRSGDGFRDTVKKVYLTILSRYPTEDELQAAEAKQGDAHEQATTVDIAWALVNSTEFLYRH